MEQPWQQSPEHKGGLNFKSCVPDGVYDLIPYSSDRHPNVWALSNPALDVHVEPGKGGRNSILIHVGNSVADVVGCIALGMVASTDDGAYVWKSVEAVNVLRALLGKESHTLEISPKGAVNE